MGAPEQRWSCPQHGELEEPPVEGQLDDGATELLCPHCLAGEVDAEPPAAGRPYHQLVSLAPPRQEPTWDRLDDLMIEERRRRRVWKHDWLK